MRAKTGVGFTLLGIMLFTVASGAHAAPVSVGHSGWAWGNPTPQGETLNAVSFIGSRGYAAGAFGTVLRSDDGGVTWAGLASGTVSSFLTLREVDPSTVVVGGGCSVRESTNAGASFTRLPINESETDCQTKTVSFSFTSAMTGYVEQTDGSIFLTQDAGHTVAARTAVPLNGASAAEIDFTSPTTGFAVTGAPGSGRIYRTTDGAGSWTQVATASQPLSGITFVTPTVAYAVGDGARLLRSTDGGASWAARPLALPAGSATPSLLHIACSDPSTCLISTRDATTLVRTTDGGGTGTLVTPSSRKLFAVAFATASRAVAVGDGGATVLSDDGGSTFPTAVSSSLPAGLAFLRRGASVRQAYAGGDRGRLASTGDGGGTWTALQVPTTAPLTDVAFPSAQIGFALDAGGTLRRTVNGGTSWGILDKGTNVVPSAVLASSPLVVVLVGPQGLLRSVNGGASFAPVGGSVVLAPARRVGRRRLRGARARISRLSLSSGAVAGGALVAEGPSGVIVSTDAGRTWRFVAPPLRRTAIERVSFISASTGYAASGSRLFFTSDGGRAWSEVNGLGTGAISDLSFSSVRVGYVATADQGLFGVGGTQVLRTVDGGHSFQPQLIGPQSIAGVIAGEGADYALDSGGELFATANGGRSPASSSLTLAVGPHRRSAAALRRAGSRIHVGGRLTPAAGGETVKVAWRPLGGRWSEELVTVASDGAFSTTLGGVRSSIDIVAQWRGDDLHGGAGTPVTRVAVTGRGAPRRRR